MAEHHLLEAATYNAYYADEEERCTQVNYVRWFQGMWYTFNDAMRAFASTSVPNKDHVGDATTVKSLSDQLLVLSRVLNLQTSA